MCWPHQNSMGTFSNVHMHWWHQPAWLHCHVHTCSDSTKTAWAHCHMCICTDGTKTGWAHRHMCICADGTRTTRTHYHTCACIEFIKNCMGNLLRVHMQWRHQSCMGTLSLLMKCDCTHTRKGLKLLVYSLGVEYYNYYYYHILHLFTVLVFVVPWF